jgi:chromosome segregation ATPase
MPFKVTNPVQNSFLETGKKKFSSSTVKCIDIDKILEKAAKLKQDTEDLKKQIEELKIEDTIAESEEEKEKQDGEKNSGSKMLYDDEDTFLKKGLDKSRDLHMAEKEIEKDLTSRMLNSIEKLGSNNEAVKRIMYEYDEKLGKMSNKDEERYNALHKKYEGENISVRYLQDTLAVKSKEFKSLRQEIQKTEEKLDKEIQKELKSGDEKDNYEKDRLK